MDEIGAASTFIYGRLTAPGTALAPVAASLAAIVGTGIYEGVAPAGATFPAVVFSLISSTDQRAQGDVRVFTAPLYLVKVIAQQESFSGASQAYGMVDALLQGGYGYVSSNGSQLWVARCNREAMVSYPEEKEQQRFSHVGGKYRLLVQADPPAVPASLVYPYA